MIYQFNIGATNSGDIDILLTHPEFTSETSKKVKIFLQAKGPLPN